MKTKRFWVVAAVCGVVALLVAAQLLGQGPRWREETAAAVSWTPAVDGGGKQTSGRSACLDVGPTERWYPAVEYACGRGLLQGMGGGSFQPEGLVTRAALVTALCQMDGGEVPAYDGGFTDVAADAWYAGPAAWAAELGLLWEESQAFRPEDPVTRGELAQILYRWAERKGYERPFSAPLTTDWDGASVAEEYQEPLAWALDSGLYDGVVSGGGVCPGMAVNRGQLAQVLVAFTAQTTGEPRAVEIAEAQKRSGLTSAARASHDQLQLLVEQVAKDYGAMGIQVAVVEAGQPVDAFAVGWAKRAQYAIVDSDGKYMTKDEGDPMTPQSKVRVASISKVAIGMVAMAMAEEGIIDLDESIGTYWGCTIRNPYYPDTPVTIRSLLTHTSSIFMAGDEVSRRYGPVYAGLSSGSSFRQLVPGSIYSWGYNNYGFGVLGMTLELAAGQTMDQLLDRYFFQALDIDGAFVPSRVESHGLLVTLYDHYGGVERSAEYQIADKGYDTPGATGSYFAGGLTISAADMSKMVAVLAGDGQCQGLRLLDPASVETMETRSPITVGDGFYQCLPLRSQDNIYGRDQLYYHTGSAYGVYHCMSYDPATGDGVVVLTTGASAVRDQYGIYAVCGEISQAVYDTLK